MSEIELLTVGIGTKVFVGRLFVTSVDFMRLNILFVMKFFFVIRT